MSWIKTDYDFGYPIINFSVGYRAVHLAVKIRDTLKSMQDGQKPTKELEQVLLNMIEFHRPNLKGGAIVGIHYGRGGLGFVIEYAHPLAPRLKQGEFVVEEPLIPDEMERRHESIKIEDEPLITE